MSYIGAEPDGMGKAQRFTYTSASGGETVVSVDDNSVPIGYTSGQVSVFLNGVKLVVGTDCIATNGSTITGLSALAASDVVEVVALSIFSATTVEGADIISTGETGTSKFLRIDGDGTSSWQTVPHTEYNDDVIQTNIAMLGFKVAVNGSLAKYDLQDQIVDEYTTNAGINTGDSTYEELTGGAYRGENPTGGDATPTITHDADATGVDGDYTWYKWTDTGATGSYSTDTAQTHEFLVVAGGGGGGGVRGGGGGAGGLRSSYGSVSGGGTSAQADLALGTSPTYTITVGAGGAAGVSSAGSGQAGGNGSVSSITGSDITHVTTVGGGGGFGNSTAGANGNAGGSGGGLTDNQAGSYNGGLGTTGEGFAGSGTVTGSSAAGGGAAGLGGNGTTPNGGTGGIGLNITITGASVGYAGGGGGGSVNTGGTVTHGGGAGASSGNGTVGVVNTGGGGGGGADASSVSGGAGGTGVVILRRSTLITASAPDNLILQSIDTTAEAAPTKADMVILIEDAGSGVASLDPSSGNIKGWVSRYETGGTKTWTQGTLVDEGDWGSDKRILAFHDLTLTGTSGTQMAYKITTHSASAVYDTKIHATSIGWR